MGRPVTLCTAQWADMPLEELCPKAKAWGFDGLELACWGVHFQVDQALEKDSYLRNLRDLLLRAVHPGDSVRWDSPDASIARLPAGVRAVLPRPVRAAVQHDRAGARGGSAGRWASGVGSGRVTWTGGSSPRF